MSYKMITYPTCIKSQKKRKVIVALKRKDIRNILIHRKDISIDGGPFLNFS